MRNTTVTLNLPAEYVAMMIDVIADYIVILRFRESRSSDPIASRVDGRDAERLLELHAAIFDQYSI